MRAGLRSTLAVLMAVTVACAGSGAGDGRPDSASPEPSPRSRPALAIEEYEETFVDTGRTTEAVGATPASDRRTLPTRVTTPAAGQPGAPYSLVVYAHGNGGNNRSGIGLQRALAAAGYVVAAPTFPFGDGRAPDVLVGAMDIMNQPGDLTYVITEVLRLNHDRSSPLHGLVEPSRIGAVGHSAGGATVLALAGNTCCYDGRVKAAVVLASGEVQFGSGEFWTRIRTPMLYVHGDADGTIPYRSGRAAYENTPPPRFLVTILGGDHGRPYGGDVNDPQGRVVVDTTLDFLDHYLLDGTTSIAQLRADATVPGVSRYLGEE
ncbi:MAG TPA: dienelactone hydrolase family protein [Egibacteraceae bacterium]|jgi:predicted dienelactone hydrolase|nr:dienelactone hydrolase family protein [Egibacteraceae bacterium]